jgi:class 3 adenylate cyclase
VTHASTDLALELVAARERERAVSDVLRAVARSQGLQPVFDAVVEAANRICNGESSGLWLSDGEVFSVASLIEYSPGNIEYERDHPHVPGRDTLTGRVILTRDAVQIPDALADPEYEWGNQEAVGYRAMLGVPVLVDDELIGVLAVTRGTPGSFPDEQVRLLTTFADQAAVAITNARLIDAVERQRTELARFLSPQIAELITSADGEQLLAGHRAYISSLFCDLRGSTAFAETAEPEELLDVIRRYHALLGELVPLHEGTLEHFAGDGVLVFFNDPVAVEDHELKAIKLALDAQRQFAEVAAEWRKRGIELGLGIGIAAGYATLGRIGFEGRYDYGALGTVNNLAARLGSQAEPGQTLVSQRVFAAVEDAVEAEAVGELELKGFVRPVLAYEVRALR